MIPRDVRLQVEAVERELDEHRKWRDTIAHKRREFLLQGTDDARQAILEIDHGVRAAEGHTVGLPNGFAGRSGLLRTSQQIVHLEERLAALLAELPSREQREAAQREATALADRINTEHAELGSRAGEVCRAIDETARLALAYTESLWTLFVENTTLDRFCADADIERPSTPRHQAPNVAAASSLASLLMAHFCGGRPAAVPSDLVNFFQRTITGPVND